MTATKTLHFTNAWHPTSGGVRTLYEALLDAAEQDGRSLALVVPGQETGVEERGRFTRIYTIRSPRAPVFDRRYRLIMPHRFLLRDEGAVWRVLEREQPDIIEVADKYTLCYLAGLIKTGPRPRPTVVGFSQERLDDSLCAQMGSRAQATRFARWYMSTIYLRQFDAHIANSDYTADELRLAAERHGPEAWLHWRHREHIHVLPLGVDRSTFGPSRRSESCRADLLRRAGGDPSQVLVFFGGRLSPEKHAHWVVPAVTAAVHRGLAICLVVAGDGPLRAEIAKQAAEHLGGRSLLLEHVRDRAVLAEIVASADLFLHPNPREPFGLGSLEAMASGVPIVLPRAGGVLAYASDQNAWLADPSPAGLGEALVRALTSPGGRLARVRQALTDTAAMDWSRVGRRFFETYDHIHATRLALDDTTGPTVKLLDVEPAFAR